MHKWSWWLLPVLCAMSAPLAAKMVEQPLAWQVDGVAYHGVLIHDDAVATARPGLLMVPNWYGVNAAAVEKAKALAGRDYVILLADLYGRPEPIAPGDSATALAAVRPLLGDRVLLRKRAAAALAALRGATNRAPIDASRLAAIGFCFGGTAVLDLARDGADLAAVVAFHAGLGTDDPALAKQIKAAVLVLSGADDAATIKEADGFLAEMRASGADWQFTELGGAVHCFTEVGEDAPGCRYDERAARRSYHMLHAWLDEAFAPR